MLFNTFEPGKFAFSAESFDLYGLDNGSQSEDSVDFVGTLMLFMATVAKPAILLKML